MPHPLDDVRLDDAALSPEFSVRIMGVLDRQGIQTHGQLRQQLKHLPAWRGLGKRSVREITSYFARIDDQQAHLFDNPVELRRVTGEWLTAAEDALAQARQQLIKIALNGYARRADIGALRNRLQDAINCIETIPVKGED